MTDITFSFGRNWQQYLSIIDDDTIAKMEQSLFYWLPKNIICNRSVLDIGSGSGLSSLCFWRSSPSRLVSFDHDPHSVEATRETARREHSPVQWEIFQGSILDDKTVHQLGQFDIVHSWGVLHHTGQLWKALDNTIKFIAPGGYLMISLYTAGDQYPMDLLLKQRFNSSNDKVKRKMIARKANQLIKSNHLMSLKEVKSGSYDRGMNYYHDIIDWLGGLPYEVAWPSEVIAFAIEKGCLPIKVKESGQGGCSEYLFKSAPHARASIGTFFDWSKVKTDKIRSRTLLDQIHSDFNSVSEQNRIWQERLSSPSYLFKKALRLLFNRLYWMVQ